MSEFNESVSGVEIVPKKKKGAVIAGVTAGVVAVAAGGSLIAYNTSDFIKNKFKLATLSSEKYYAWVNDKNADEQIEYLSEQYDEYVKFFGENAEKGLHSNISLTYTMSDGLKTLLRSSMGGTERANAFVDNINNVSLNVDESLFKGVMGYNMGLDFNGTALADIDFFMDYKDLFAMARIPQITEKYIGIDYKSLLEDVGYDDDEEKMLDTMSKFYSNPESILTKDEFRKLAEKYTSLWNECVTEVKEEKNEEITVGNYTNEYTVLTVEINNELASNTAEKYINTIKEDELIKDIIINRLEICDEATYISNLDDALAEFKDEDNYDDSVVYSKTYVDANGTIRGYKLMDDDETGFEIIFTGKDEENANGVIKFYDGDETEVTCNIDYTCTDGKYNGSADLTVDEYGDDTKISVGFTDLETVNEKYGFVNGNLDISVDDSAPFALFLTSDGSSQKASFVLDIEDMNYGSIDMEISFNEIDSMENPDKSQAFMIDSNTNSFEGYATEDDLMNFIASIIKNIGFAQTDEEARDIVNGYVYGTSYNPVARQLY